MRRAFLQKLALGVGALVAAVAAAPVLRLALAPWRRRGSVEPEVDVGALARFSDQAPTRVALVARTARDAYTLQRDVRLGAALVLRVGDGARAWSTVCPHAGCAVDAVAGGGFGCPCHDSRFGADGTRLSGPSPRDLDPLPARVVGGRVLVTVRRYQNGVRERRS